MGMPDRSSLNDQHRYRVLLSIPHDDLPAFVLEYFWRQRTLLTVGHHLLSLGLLVCWIVAGIGTPWEGWLLTAGIAVGSFAVCVLPLHEALHILSYRILGARDIRWSLRWQPFAVSVVAHNFVLDRLRFLVLATLPSLCITGGLIVLAAIAKTWAFPALALCLLHHGGTAGDAALVNVFWVHRARTLFTFDDGEAGATFFVEPIR